MSGGQDSDSKGHTSGFDTEESLPSRRESSRGSRGSSPELSSVPHSDVDLHSATTDSQSMAETRSTTSSRSTTESRSTSLRPNRRCSLVGTTNVVLAGCRNTVVAGVKRERPWVIERARNSLITDNFTAQGVTYLGPSPPRPGSFVDYARRLIGHHNVPTEPVLVVNGDAIIGGNLYVRDDVLACNLLALNCGPTGAEEGVERPWGEVHAHRVFASAGIETREINGGAATGTMFVVGQSVIGPTGMTGEIGMTGATGTTEPAEVIVVPPGISTVYAYPAQGPVVLRLRSGFAEGATVTIKDVTRIMDPTQQDRPYQVTVITREPERITEGTPEEAPGMGEPTSLSVDLLERFNRQGELMVDTGPYVLDTLNGAVTLRYTRQLPIAATGVWTIQSQFPGVLPLMS